MTERSCTVVGMTCDHCVLSVRENVSDAAVGDAVADAGYEVAA
jgi:copper chaperone CopZ